MVEFRRRVANAPCPAKHAEVVANHPDDAGEADVARTAMDVGCISDYPEIEGYDGELEKHECDVSKNKTDLEPVEKREKIMFKVISKANVPVRDTKAIMNT